MRLALFGVALLALTAPALAMDGVNVDTGETISVDDGTTFNVGDTVAMFDADGNEFDVQVQAVNEKDDAIDVDVTDPDSGETATVEFTK